MQAKFQACPINVDRWGKAEAHDGNQPIQTKNVKEGWIIKAVKRRRALEGNLVQESIIRTRHWKDKVQLDFVDPIRDKAGHWVSWERTNRTVDLRAEAGEGQKIETAKPERKERVIN